jgi:alanine dehydrogenase
MASNCKIPPVYIVSRVVVETILCMNDTLPIIERVFRLRAEGHVLMPPKLYLNLPQFQGDFRAMPAYVDDNAGMKWVSGYPNNHRYNLPGVMATIILCDPQTGRPLAIMDGTYITSLRTGATGGIAAKYLARKNASVIGMIGAGVQARTQLLALQCILPHISEVKAYDKLPETSHKFAADMAEHLGPSRIRSVATVAAAADADIIVTTTPSREPVLLKEHIRPGTHINAIGADGPGKQELDPAILKAARVVVDDMEQAAHGGEINVPLSEGYFHLDEIHGTLGEIIAGRKKGREKEDEITVFDSTGLAFQDIVCARLVYDRIDKDKTCAVELY